jgi:hypothetical protein
MVVIHLLNRKTDISRELYDGAVVKVKENSRPSRKRG